jgi:hypothetical protein
MTTKNKPSEGRHVFALRVLSIPLFGCCLCACTSQDENTQEQSQSELQKHIASPEFQQEVQARLNEMKRDEAVIESAPWFGKTGLSDETERELPRYLRREHGQMLADKGSIKAADLGYIGVFTEGDEIVHYWRINYGSGSNSPEPAYAYVVAAPADRVVIAWGDRKPPQ